MDNTNKPAGGSKNKKLFVILGLVLVVAIIVVAAMMSGKQKSGDNSGDNQSANGEVKADVPADSQPYVPEGAATDENGELMIPEALKEATVTVVGANPIAKDGTVVTTEGVAVKNDAVPMSPEAPKQTPPVAKEQLAASVLKLDISSAGFNPTELSVKAGNPVTLAITSTDDFTHVFMFDDPSLSAVAVGVSPHETRAITFNAPSKAGDYAFHCDVPGHSGRGEVGKLIVK